MVEMEEAAEQDLRPVRVFISYAHESDEHTEQVRSLWVLLRSLGVDAKLDQSAAVRRQDWSLWMADQVRWADHVLCIASPAYKRRAEGRAESDEGRGVQWEARLIRDAFYADQANLQRFLPVVLPGNSPDDVPDFLAPHTTTVYYVERFSLPGIKPLYGLLTRQVIEEEPPLGKVVPLGGRVERTPAQPVSTLHHEIDVVVSNERGQLVTQTLLAGTELGVHRARLPAGVTRVWTAGPDASQAAARQRLQLAGQALATALFSPETLQNLRQLIDGSAFGTNISLTIHADETTVGLPFEILAPPDGSPWALTPGLRMIRRLAGIDRPATPLLPGPLKILAAVAAPEETRTPNQPLNVEAEMQAVLDATSSITDESSAQVRILEVASLPQISEALRQDQFHVLHLSAHGNSAGIELEDEDGSAVFASTEELVTAMRAGKKPIPLVVLSSCAGAAGGDTGLAASLIRHGADRVVAMQAPVIDSYATELARELYRALATEGTATVGAALADARQRVDSWQRSVPETAAALVQYPVPTVLAAGVDLPLRKTSAADQPLSSRTLPPSGTGVRALPMGALIGRRRQVRTAVTAMRGDPADKAKVGDWAGVVFTGVGGIGKSAVAGRTATRLREAGWLVVEHVGRWNPPELIEAVATALQDAGGNQQTVDRFGSADIADAAELAAVSRILRDHPLLLIFDDFEQNLTDDGTEFRDPGFAESFRQLIEATERGRLLVTCRYPVPAADELLRIEIPPLTSAEQQRMYLRLPALRTASAEDRRFVEHMVGGHPRMLEFLNVLLQHGTASEFRHVTGRLRKLARQEEIDIQPERDLATAVSEVVRLGARDILLDGLFDQLTPSERELLLQAAVGNAPAAAEDFAVALHGADPAPELVREVRRDIATLVDRTLLSAVSAATDEYIVHPWIAQGLLPKQGSDQTRRHQQAADMRAYRLSRGVAGFADLVELVRQLAASNQADEAVSIAWRTCQQLEGQVAVSAYLNEVLPSLPTEHPGYLNLADTECRALIATGRVSATITRRIQLLELCQSQVAERPEDDAALRNLSTSHITFGDLAMQLGAGPAAAEHYQAALTIDQRRATIEPGNAGTQRDLSISHDRRGNVALRTGDTSTAAQHYRAALAIRQRLATAEPGDAQVRRDLSISHGKLGDLALLTGDTTTATEHYQASLSIDQRRVITEPDDMESQRDLSISQSRLGDLAVRTGDTTAATEHYQAALDIHQRLADPTNTETLRDLSIGHGKRGDLALLTGDTTTATEHYQAALDIDQRLVTIDPTNAQAQRDLSISHSKLGDVALRTDDTTSATEHYQAALDIHQRLAADPTNAEAQRDLGSSHEKLGDLALLTGDTTTATEHYQAALGIRQRLAIADRDNAEAQRDLSISHNRLGDLALRADDSLAATEHYQAALTISQRLATADPGNAQAQRDLSISHNKLGDLALRTGGDTGAAVHYQAAYAIHQQLAAADPDNVLIQRELAALRAKLDKLGPQDSAANAAD